MRIYKCVCGECSQQAIRQCDSEAADLCSYAYVFERFICDKCEKREAKYVISGMELCEECAKKFLKDKFGELSLSEMSELLDVDLGDPDDLPID